MESVVAIHQPNFLPWLGYFHKILRSDTFVLLDGVQIQKTGGSYVNRVQIAVNQTPYWFTVPIVRNYHGTKPISEIEINFREPWQTKNLRTVQMNYARTEHFEEFFALLEELFAYETNLLAEFNINAIERIRQGLGLTTTKIVRSSEHPSTKSATDLLIDLTKACGGTTYLSGGGAEGYQETALYEAHGISLRFQAFKHPTYPQGKGNFLPGLSILDALMHLGWRGTRELLESVPVGEQ